MHFVIRTVITKAEQCDDEACDSEARSLIFGAKFEIIKAIIISVIVIR